MKVMRGSNHQEEMSERHFFFGSGLLRRGG